MKNLDKLLKSDQKVFHSQDLALLWGISGNTLYTAIKRYCKKGFLQRIYKGMYTSVKNINDLDPFLLGVKTINSYCYISTESILAKNGFINQNTNQITLVSSVSRRFQIGKFSFISRQLQDKFLYNDTEIFIKNNIKFASPQRALADMLYFNSKFYIDNKKLINFNKLKKIQKKVGYKK